jgi:ribosome maturation factor RimP
LVIQKVHSIFASCFERRGFQGTIVPCFFAMINASTIRELAEKKLEENESFLVDVTVSASNKIRVTIDNFNGLAINECVSMSRWIENELDRETEDYELEVSSPGLDQPFKVFRQYQKNIGREVEVKLNDGQKLEGKLTKAADQQIEIEQKSREKIEGQKGKQSVTRQITLPLDKIKETRIIIKF